MSVSDGGESRGTRETSERKGVKAGEGRATHVVHGADVVLKTWSTAILAGAVGVEGGLQ